MTKKTDHRVRVTHALLKDALVSVLKDMPLSEVTIKTLCERADVNRSTFYAHFAGIHELIEAMEEDVFEELNTIIDRVTNDPSYIRKQVFVDIFTIGKEHHQMFHFLLIDNIDPMFVEKIFNMGEHAFEHVSHVLKRTHSKEFMKYIYTAVLSSVIAIISRWISTGMKEPLDDIADMTRLIVNRGVDAVFVSQKTI